MFWSDPPTDPNADFNCDEEVLVLYEGKYRSGKVLSKIDFGLTPSYWVELTLQPTLGGTEEYKHITVYSVDDLQQWNPHRLKKCECGASSVGHLLHTHYCPLYK